MRLFLSKWEEGLACVPERAVFLRMTIAAAKTGLCLSPGGTGPILSNPIGPLWGSVLLIQVYAAKR